LSFALDASHLSLISGLLVASAVCLKHGNLDKFESRSFDGILDGYTPHDRSYRVFNLETNTIVEPYDVTFNETSHCPRDAFECAGDKEVEKNIFVDEKLQGFDGDKDEPLHPSTSSPELFPASTLEAEASQATTSSTTAIETSRVGDHLRTWCSLSYSEGTSISTDHRQFE
jgi:hypothetical protein